MESRFVATLTGVVLAALIVSGVPGMATTNSPQTPARPAANTVTVVMKDRSFQSSTRTVPAGKVTFVVRNAGTMEHEFVVLRTGRHHHLLSMKSQQASEAGAKGEIEEFASGRTKRLTLTLAPGKYVLLCNIVKREAGELNSHYEKGMYASLTVE